MRAGSEVDGDALDDKDTEHEGSEHDTDEQSEAPFEFEGIDDKETATALSDVARELKLDNAAAQKIVDKMAPAVNARIVRLVQATVEGWDAETRADTEIGGSKIKATIADAQRALDVYGKPELRKLLGPVSKGGTGLGNHKEIVRFLAKVGRVVAKDRAPSNVPSQPTTPAMNRLANSFRSR